MNKNVIEIPASTTYETNYFFNPWAFKHEDKVKNFFSLSRCIYRHNEMRTGVKDMGMRKRSFPHISLKLYISDAASLILRRHYERVSEHAWSQSSLQGGVLVLETATARH